MVRICSKIGHFTQPNRVVMKIEITLPDKDRDILERWLKSRAKSDKQKFRAKIILMSADGMLTREIMARLGSTNVTLNV